MQSQNTIGATVQAPRTISPRSFRLRFAATIIASLCGLSTIIGFASMADAQDPLPAAACEAYTKWERGELNPQYVDIALLPLKDVTLPANLDSVVKGLAGRKFQGQAEEQAIQKLVEFYKAGCANAGGGNAGGTIAATSNTAAGAAAPAATPVATTLPAAVTPSPGTPAATTAPTRATPAPTTAPAKQLPNTGFNRASSGLAMLGGWLLLAGIAVSLFNRQRN